MLSETSAASCLEIDRLHCSKPSVILGIGTITRSAVNLQISDARFDILGPPNTCSQIDARILWRRTNLHVREIGTRIVESRMSVLRAISSLEHPLA